MIRDMSVSGSMKDYSIDRSEPDFRAAYSSSARGMLKYSAASVCARTDTHTRTQGCSRNPRRRAEYLADERGGSFIL